MSVYRISYRYANSLMQLAEEKMIFKKVSDDAELIFNTLNSSKELRSVLKSPVVKLNDKKSLLQKIFEKKISNETASFINFVVEKNREDILFDIFKEFIALADKKNGIVKARVVSPFDLNDQSKQKMIDDLSKKTNKKVSANYNIDTDLIGGFIVRIEDTVYDASVKHQLSLLRKKFSEEIILSNN
ncbi:MAG: ATP synthase F1 subunit delta [Ignavibacteriales bacterium]|nr:ATP synthase F1 subunit delta [Ignavibacteriales bacterium]